MATTRRFGLVYRRVGVIIPIGHAIREVPIGPHTVARFYEQPYREAGFQCALCQEYEYVCQGHGPQAKGEKP